MAATSGRRTGRATSEQLVVDGQQVQLRRSTRRHRTVSAYRDGDKVVVLVPANMSATQERRWVTEMLRRTAGVSARSEQCDSDDALSRRACRLVQDYLPGVAAPASVRWVSGMRTRWASCTSIDRTIRVSIAVRGMPDWVLDYVLVHELAHLVAPGHDAGFWALVGRYPRTDRARGYLEGVSAAAGLDLSDLDDPQSPHWRRAAPAGPATDNPEPEALCAE